MSLSLQKMREIVFQFLYSYDLGLTEPDQLMQLLMKELSVTKKNVKIAEERARKVFELCPTLDEKIGSTSQEYSFERIYLVERNILRLGLYEIEYDDEIPPKVAISEALRLAKKFSTPESTAFVNAILDHLNQEQNEGTLPPK